MTWQSNKQVCKISRLHIQSQVVAYLDFSGTSSQGPHRESPNSKPAMPVNSETIGILPAWQSIITDFWIIFQFCNVNNMVTQKLAGCAVSMACGYMLSKTSRSTADGALLVHPRGKPEKSKPSLRHIANWLLINQLQRHFSERLARKPFTALARNILAQGDTSSSTFIFVWGAESYLVG